MTRILIADDSDVIRRGLELLLNNHRGWQVCGEAVDGQDAIDKVQELSPDVVVLDFSMPRLNGIEAAREILRIRPRTKIVLCSMYLNTHIGSLADKAGIHASLSKDSIGRIVSGVEDALRCVSPGASDQEQVNKRVM